MNTPTLPVLREADGHDDQLKVQIDADPSFRTTLEWLRIDSQGRCTQNKVIVRAAHGATLCLIDIYASVRFGMQEEKGAVVARLRVPFRDLRILDPMVSFALALVQCCS